MGLEERGVKMGVKGNWVEDWVEEKVMGFWEQRCGTC